MLSLRNPSSPKVPPKTEAEKLKNRAELVSLKRPALITRYTEHMRTKVWRELSNDERVHLFMTHPSNLESSQFEALEQRMESHNKFLRNPPFEPEFDKKGYGYFTQYASIIQRSPMPAESTTLICETNWRGTEWGRGDPRGQTSCSYRCLGPSCGGITTFCVSALSLFKCLSVSATVGVGLGACACVACSGFAYTCCVIPHQAKQESITRTFHERVLLARAPGPQIQLRAAPAGPLPGAAAE